MIRVKEQAIHSTIGGVPKVIGISGSGPVAASRTFPGQGAPSATTLPAGVFNAANNGFIVNVSVANGGAGYKPLDQLTESAASGEGIELQLTVDSVDQNGMILTADVLTAGEYSTYPPSPAPFMGGSGAGAQFNLNFPALDYYLDITTPTAPVLYVCTTSGDNQSSVWAKISGGAGGSSACFLIVGRGNNDYVQAMQVNGWQLESSTGFYIPTGFSSNVQVAKYEFARRSITSILSDGVVYAVGTPNGGDLDNNRTTTPNGGAPQSEFCDPRYYTAAEIQSNVFPTRTVNNLPRQAQCYIMADQPSGGTGVPGAQWQETVKRDWDALT